jgi:hypothetical protein
MKFVLILSTEMESNGGEDAVEKLRNPPQKS